MSQLNDFLTDTNYNGYTYYIPMYETPPTEIINRGNSYTLSFQYQPLKHVEFGVYGVFQSGEIERFPVFSTELWGDTTSYDLNYTIKTSNYSFGLNSTFFIDKILKLEEKKNFLKHVMLGVKIAGGIGFSKLRDLTIYPTSEQRLYNHRATSFQGDFSFLIGAKISAKSFISSVGLKFGYQYLKTNSVENSYGTGLYGTAFFDGNQQVVNLDFSGLYIGAFLKLGKQ